MNVQNKARIGNAPQDQGDTGGQGREEWVSIEHKQLVG